MKNQSLRICLIGFILGISVTVNAQMSKVMGLKSEAERIEKEIVAIAPVALDSNISEQQRLNLRQEMLDKMIKHNALKNLYIRAISTIRTPEAKELLKQQALVQSLAEQKLSELRADLQSQLENLKDEHKPQMYKDMDKHFKNEYASRADENFRKTMGTGFANENFRKTMGTVFAVLTWLSIVMAIVIGPLFGFALFTSAVGTTYTVSYLAILMAGGTVGAKIANKAMGNNNLPTIASEMLIDHPEVAQMKQNITAMEKDLKIRTTQLEGELFRRINFYNIVQQATLESDSEGQNKTLP